MVREIRIYIEGDPQLRQGFRGFLNPLYEQARSQNIKMEPPKLCGGRDDTYKAFKVALKTYPDAFIALLVDSDRSIAKNQTSWDYLKQEYNWDALGTDETHCYLMVQTMEAWLVADPDALASYYGKGFQINALPKIQNVETLDKDKLNNALEIATRNTSKGKYHKTRHASELLVRVQLEKVRKAAWNCDRLFSKLSAQIGTA